MNKIPKELEEQYKQEKEREAKASLLKAKFLSSNLEPLEIASNFVKEYPHYYDERCLWWSWNEKEHIWKRTDEINILNILTEAFHIQGITSNNLKSSFITALKLEARKNKPEELSKEWIQFKDIIINYETGETKPTSSQYFSLNSIPHKLGKSEETPQIDALFESWQGKEGKQTLYEICAYCMVRDYFIQRYFIFLGSGNNGKSTYTNLLRRFLGADNCTSTELDVLLSNRFETISLWKKLACFMGETNFNTLKNTSTLKKLTGGDLIRFELKGINPFPDYNHAKIIISTNNLPSTTDKTKGFYKRPLILDWNQEFSEKKDILEIISEREFENLARKSIRILKELAEKCAFTGEGTIEERMKRYEAKSEPLEHFIQEECIKDANSEIKSFEFNSIFQNWLSQRGYRKISDIEIGKQLKAKGYEKKSKHYTKEDGTQGSYNIILSLRWKHIDGDDGDDGVISLQPLYKSSSKTTPSSPSSPSIYKLLDAVLMPCSRCHTVEIPCKWEDKTGALYCEICAHIMQEGEKEESYPDESPAVHYEDIQDNEPEREDK